RPERSRGERAAQGKCVLADCTGSGLESAANARLPPPDLRTRYLDAAFILSAVNRKSELACGLWHSKQLFRFAFSLTFRSGVNTWYSHSPFRFSSGYSAPHPVRFSTPHNQRGHP